MVDGGRIDEKRWPVPRDFAHREAAKQGVVEDFCQILRSADGTENRWEELVRAKKPPQPFAPKVGCQVFPSFMPPKGIGRGKIKAIPMNGVIRGGD